MEMPAVMKPLVDAVGRMDTSLFGLLLKSAALHLQVRDHEIDVSTIEQSLDDHGLSSEAKDILQGCIYLVKEAGTCGGVGAAKLASTLEPFGIEESYTSILHNVIEWVQSGGEVEPSSPSAGESANMPDEDPTNFDDDKMPGDTIRRYAVSGQASKLAEALRSPSGGSLINATDDRGYTAYHFACGGGQPSCIQVLLDAGCDVSKKNAVGFTGWRLAMTLNSTNKKEVLELLEASAASHDGLRAEKEKIDDPGEDDDDAPVLQGSADQEWRIKIGNADDSTQDGQKFTVYVVEVWCGDKRLAVTHRRYSEFHDMRKKVLEALVVRALDFAEQEAAERVKQLDFPKKTMLPMSKNSEKVRKERSTMLQRWLNAALKELGKTTELCRFLGLNPEFIGITIVKEKNISEYKDLYDTTPLGRRKGLCAGQLPSKVILGIDDTGAQLFDGATRQPIAGEGYPYHLIRSWSWHQPADAAWHVVLTFGDDQKGYRLELGTQKGKEICAKMREYATLLAVNLRKESLEQQDTDVLQRKLDEMEERLRRLEAAEGGSAFKKHTRLAAEIQAVKEVLQKRGKDSKPPELTEAEKKAKRRAFLMADDDVPMSSSGGGIPRGSVMAGGATSVSSPPPPPPADEDSDDAL